MVFSDDWGRHPSSCQHLVRHLLPRYPALWVNTIGTRRPRLSLADVGRALGKLIEWFGPGDKTALPANLQVISPRMYPGYRTGMQRRFNTNAVRNAVNRALAEASRGVPPPAKPRQPGGQRIAVTTLPITADLIGQIEVDRWVYYCVDDFSVWPGMDGEIMDKLERELVPKVDACVAVNDALRRRLASMGVESTVLTHGIDIEHWRDAKPAQRDWWTPTSQRPMCLFWGLLDRRLDVEWCKALAGRGDALCIYAGPQNDPPADLHSLPNSATIGPVPYDQLPALAVKADVLIMPYVDAPVTRAMQPLKFKEYLATGKPVVARDLPAIREWADAADLVSDSESFVGMCLERARTGLPESQRAARQRLSAESWSEKALQFEAVLIG